MNIEELKLLVEAINNGNVNTEQAINHIQTLGYVDDGIIIQFNEVISSINDYGILVGILEKLIPILPATITVIPLRYWLKRNATGYHKGVVDTLNYCVAYDSYDLFDFINEAPIEPPIQFEIMCSFILFDEMSIGEAQDMLRHDLDCGILSKSIRFLETINE